MEFENKELCRECGGKCCKKSGCDYYVTDFDVINKASMIEVLDSGKVSIVAALMMEETKDDKLLKTPFLYLRARNVGRDVVDLFSLKHQCTMLQSDGCAYSLEERPSGGVNFIPYENDKCKRCDNPKEEIRKWEPYQNLLMKLVKRYTHMSVDERLSLDAEQLFMDVFNENFEGVAKEEIEDILKGLADFARSFPEEYERARAKCLLTSKVLRRTQ